jgi:arylsulfatase A-like enzyme
MNQSAIRVQKAGEIVLTAVWFGLLTGLIQLAIDGVRFFGFNRFTFTNREVIWMAPSAYVLQFLALAAVLIMVACLKPRWVPLGWTVTCFAFLGALSLMLRYGKIAPYASLLIALGVGVQFARVMGKDPIRWRHRLRRSGAAMAVTIIMLALAARAWWSMAERRAFGSLPPAAAGAPNVLVIILDTVRAASMSLYGYSRPTTPELQRVGAEGVVFDHAISTAPWTLPSHGSIFTGQYPSSLRAGWRIPIHNPGEGLAEIFREQGYATGGFVANLRYTSYQSGLAAGFVHYEDYPISIRQIFLHSSLRRMNLWGSLTASKSLRQAVGRLLSVGSWRLGTDPAEDFKNASRVSSPFLDWQRTLGGRPFFAFLNYFDAHDPYRPPGQFRNRFGSPNERINLYDGAIAYLDQEMGRILTELEGRHVLDHTIVIIASDHGDQFGEHHLTKHGNSLYLPLIHVPLIIRYPGHVPAGRRVGEVVSLRDLPATILDLAGVENHGRIPGVPLAGLGEFPEATGGSPAVSELEKGINVSTSFPNARGSMKSIIDEGFHYIIDGDGREALYAYPADLAEESNLAATEEGHRQLARLRTLLSRTIAQPQPLASRAAPLRQP